MFSWQFPNSLCSFLLLLLFSSLISLFDHHNCEGSFNVLYSADIVPMRVIFPLRSGIFDVALDLIHLTFFTAVLERFFSLAISRYWTGRRLTKAGYIDLDAPGLSSRNSVAIAVSVVIAVVSMVAKFGTNGIEVGRSQELLGAEVHSGTELGAGRVSRATFEGGRHVNRLRFRDCVRFEDLEEKVKTGFGYSMKTCKVNLDPEGKIMRVEAGDVLAFDFYHYYGGSQKVKCSYPGESSKSKEYYDEDGVMRAYEHVIGTCNGRRSIRLRPTVGEGRYTRHFTVSSRSVDLEEFVELYAAMTPGGINLIPLNGVLKKWGPHPEEHIDLFLNLAGWSISREGYLTGYKSTRVEMTTERTLATSVDLRYYAGLFGLIPLIVCTAVIATVAADRRIKIDHSSGKCLAKLWMSDEENDGKCASPESKAFLVLEDMGDTQHIRVRGKPVFGRDTGAPILGSFAAVGERLEQEHPRPPGPGVGVR